MPNQNQKNKREADRIAKWILKEFGGDPSCDLYISQDKYWIFYYNMAFWIAEDYISVNVIHHVMDAEPYIKFDKVSSPILYDRLLVLSKKRKFEFKIIRE